MVHIYLLRILPLVKTEILKSEEKRNINFRGFKCQNWVPQGKSQHNFDNMKEQVSKLPHNIRERDHL